MRPPRNLPRNINETPESNMVINQTAEEERRSLRERYETSQMRERAMPDHTPNRIVEDWPKN